MDKKKHCCYLIKNGLLTCTQKLIEAGIPSYFPNKGSIMVTYWLNEHNESFNVYNMGKTLDDISKDTSAFEAIKETNDTLMHSKLYDNYYQAVRENEKHDNPLIYGIIVLGFLIFILLMEKYQ